MDCAMNVRMSITDDFPFVQEFLSQMLKTGDVYEQYEDSMVVEESRFISLIMTCENQIVGLASKFNSISKGLTNVSYSKFCISRAKLSMPFSIQLSKLVEIFASPSTGQFEY